MHRNLHHPWETLWRCPLLKLVFSNNRAPWQIIGRILVEVHTLEALNDCAGACVLKNRKYSQEGIHIHSLFTWCRSLLDLSYLGNLLCHPQRPYLNYIIMPGPLNPFVILGHSSGPPTNPNTFVNSRWLWRGCSADGDFLRDVPCLKKLLKAN